MQITISKESNPKENNSLKISVSWNNDILAYAQLNPTKKKKKVIVSIHFLKFLRSQTKGQRIKREN
jgi:hypothetical protein